MRRMAVLLMTSAALTWGQRSEIGARAGFGAVAAEDVSTAGAVAFGIEACGLCSGRLGLFGEYTHMETVGGARANGITRFDVLAGGVRVQGGRRIRPFFDAGVAYGVDAYRWSGGSNSHGNPGIVLAGGVSVSVRDQMYVRPQFRFYVLRALHAIALPAAGFGIRF